MASAPGIVITFVLCASFKAISSSPTHHKRSCDDLRLCLDDFPMLVDLVEKDNAGALATLTYKTLLNNVCSKRQALSTCLGKSSCNEFEHYYTGRAIRDILGYICGSEGRETLMSESGCFSRDSFEWGIYQCSKAMKLETDIVTLQIQTETADSSRFCNVFDNLLQCVRVNVQRTCSTRAADFTSSVFGHAIRSLAKHIGCTINFG